MHTSLRYLDDYQIVLSKLIAIESLQSTSNFRQLGESGLFVDELFTVEISESLTIEANPGKKIFYKKLNHTTITNLK